jgi:hypothetical protein
MELIYHIYHTINNLSKTLIMFVQFNGLYYEGLMIVIYDRNGSGQNYVTMNTAMASLR